jgi:hypothetical protein
MRNAECGMGINGASESRKGGCAGELPTDLLWSRFHDHIEGRFRGTAVPRKSALRENVLIP